MHHGLQAGPPGRPTVSAVTPSSAVLTWEEPDHWGGNGLSITGYCVLVQCGGEGGFSSLVLDTGSDKTSVAVEGLRADTWHEFRVAALTAAGRGAPSRPSRPVQTERKPRLP